MSFSQLLGAKPVDGIRLSQSLWAKSENLLRSASHVLGTAEFSLSAVGALLQGKEGDDLAEVKSLLQEIRPLGPLSAFSWALFLKGVKY